MNSSMPPLTQNTTGQSLSDFSGNSTAVSQARAWAKSWEQGNKVPPLLITGHTGVGKTYLAHALAGEMGWELFEFNASDLRNEEAVSQLLSNAASSGSLLSGRRLVLVDDADSLSGAADRGGAGAIAKVIESASQPMIITANDLYSKKLQPIKSRCTVIELRRLHPSSIAALVRRQALRIGMAIPPEAAEAIAKSVCGDARAALNDLAARNFSASRDREKDIFEVVKTILKSEKYSEARSAAFSSEVDHDTLKLWVAQNIPSEYKTPFEISEAYGSISRADIFDGRIKRAQYWGYLRYSGDLMSSGVALAKSGPSHGYNPTTFPDYIRAMGASRGRRALRKSTLSKIARVCHCSVTAAQDYLPAIRENAKTHAQPLITQFGFDEDELLFLADTGALPNKSGTGKKTAKKKV
jgi:replication factor C large subunit